MGAVTPKWLLILTLASASAGGEPLRAAQDLDYGESLYHYYTGDFPSALTTLELAGEDMTGHGHYPQLMRAGMYMAYGMREQAAREFARHLGRGEPAAVRNTAHYYLAKLHYRAGDFNAARAELDKISGALAPELQGEAALLRVNLAIKTAPAPSLDGARTLLEPLGDNRHLALLNLGNSAARAGDPIRAQSYYRALVEADIPESEERTREYLAIRDKAYTALGYSYLAQKDYASAKAAFRSVRLDTALANRALLGYGWAAASYHDYVLALKPWQALRQRSLLDPAVQEALIAVPWAYEQMGAKNAALRAYRESEQLLSERLAGLDKNIAATDAELVLDLLGESQSGAYLNSGNSDRLQNWLSLERVNVIHSDLTYLDPLLRSDRLQESAQALKDLVALAKQQRQWREDLAIYTSLLEDKRTRRSERAETIASRGTLTQSQTLQAERDALAAQLADIEARGDALALADADTRKLAERVERARANLDLLRGNRPVPTQAGEKLDLLEGILLWRAAQQFPANAWQVQKSLNKAEHALAQSEQTGLRIQRLLAEDPDIDGQLERIGDLRSRNRAMLERLEGAIDDRAERLAASLRKHLSGHRSRLNDYLAQTRLSMARLLDDAYRIQATGDDLQLPEVAP